MIFDKVLDQEIEKAIILRDGKPSFLLMEFEKYENIMAEFEELKEYVESLENGSVKKVKDKSKNKKKDKNLESKQKETLKKEIQQKIEQPIEKEKKVSKTIEKVVEEPVVEVEEILILEEETETEELVDNIDNEQNENMIEQELSEEEELNNAFQSIESMNFDDDMKKMAQDKIKVKILQARKERAEALALQEKEMQEEEQEEQKLQEQIKQEKVKKERELKEFWD